MQQYTDLYALFRRNPAAEEYFNHLPVYVQEQVAARYRAIDSVERLVDYADRARRDALDVRYSVEEIGGALFLPGPSLF